MKYPRSRWGHSDPYRVLGVHTGASQQDITRAYRRAVQRLHPDTQPDDPEAAGRFQAVADAYDLLRDPARRADYDRAHPADEPVSQGVQPGLTGMHAYSPGPPYLLPLAPGQPVWAGPVYVEPPAADSQQGQGGEPPAARFEDPPIILDLPAGPRWSWPW